ncbi:MAG: mechanosensitive ion channel domain-containing protein [Pseudomonadota bacterium]
MGDKSRHESDPRLHPIARAVNALRLVYSVLVFLCATVLAVPALAQQGDPGAPAAVGDTAAPAEAPGESTSPEVSETASPIGPDGGQPIGSGLFETLREGAETATNAARDIQVPQAEDLGAPPILATEPAQSGVPTASNSTGASGALAEQSSAGPAGAALAPPRDPLGTRIIAWFETWAETTGEATITDFAVAERKFQALSGLSEPEIAAIAEIIPPLAILVSSGLILAYLMRSLVRPVMRRLGSASIGMGPIGKVLIGVFSAVIDFIAMILAGIAAYLVVTFLRPETEIETSIRVSFIAAYFVASVLIVALRAFFSPATPHVRLLPIQDATARAWTFHLTLVIVFFAFSEIFAATILRDITSPEFGEGFVMLINVAVLLYLAVLVTIYRAAPKRFVQQRLVEDEESILFISLSALVPFWLVVAYAYLAFLVHQSVTSGGRGIPLLVNTLKIAVAIAITVTIFGYLQRIATRGIRLSDKLNAGFPTLEHRINAFVPFFTRLLRATVGIILVVFVLQTIGFVALWDGIERRLGIDIVGTTTSLIVIGFTGFLVWLMINGWIDYRLTPRHGHVATPREQTLLALLRNAALIAILLFVLISSLAEIGVSVAPLLASAGVVGLAIGFGSQKLVQDIITGVFIQFENAINVGDVIEAGGKTGVVEKLTIRSVSLRDVQGVFHVIPFSSVDLVSNHMMGYSYHLADIGIAYREDIDGAKKEMLAAFADMQRDPEWCVKLLGDIEWFGVQELADSAVILRARLKTRAGEQWGAGRAYTERVKKRFDAAGIEIPFPHLTLWFGEQKHGPAPPAHVSFASSGLATPSQTGPDRSGGMTKQTVHREVTTDADSDES